MVKKIAIVTTHPIQYNAPSFRMLDAEPNIDVRVFYTWHIGNESKPDAGFGKAFAWDIPLLEGYEYELVGPSTPVVNRTFRNMDSPGLSNRIQLWNPDAVLVYGYNFAAHLKTMRIFKGKIPVWFRGDSTLLDESPGIKRFLRRQMLRRVYKSVDLALAVGQNSRDYFLAHGLKPDQIEIVPHAIDNDRFGDSEHDEIGQQMKTEFGFSDTDIVVLFAGKFEPVKAPLDLATAFLNALKSRPNLRLLFVGSGPLETELKAKIGSCPQVVFAPFQNQSKMPAVYRAGDIICLPSHSETWGLCLNEAMACGRPVIASDHVGAFSDLVNSQTGFCFSAGNIDQLTNVLTKLPDRSELLRMGTHCKEFIKGWSIPNFVKKISAQLNQLN